MINRFLLFYGAEYYPEGGWDDFQGSFKTQEEAQKYAKVKNEASVYRFDHWDWAHIVDAEHGTIYTYYSREDKWRT